MGSADPVELRLVDAAPHPSGGADDDAWGSDPPPLRAVGPGFDGGPASGPDVAQAALEDLTISRSPEVAAGDPWAEAGRKVVRFHLTRMLTHVPATMAGEDPEAVHDMRVAARRVRAAWRVFGNAYERPVVRHHTAEIRVLGGRLGAVRDLDVQLAILTAYREQRSKRARTALAPLVEAWTAARAERHADLVAHLGSPWFGMLVADHKSFVDAAPDDVVRGPAPATVRTAAPAVTWDAYGEVWAFEPDVGGADVETLHDVRIATKWLRYTLEFVREPMEPTATELIRRVVALQDHLGDIHDLHAAAAHARQVAAARPEFGPSTQTAVARFAAAQDVRVERLRGRLGPPWREVADAGFRRRLGRALART